MDPNGTYTVHLPLEIGKRLGGGGDRGRIPVRVTIEGIPFNSQLYAKSAWDAKRGRPVPKKFLGQQSR